ncbi:hypothetical protein FACS189426_05910 [Bacteroidia bacterium]|nr:hypothetical protein FACS189426_05910 [Bacteroidia bacterium]GHV70777.1 hypothetical protein FACS189420_3280 [Bacteroidia bacterium]
MYQSSKTNRNAADYSSAMEQKPLQKQGVSEKPNHTRSKSNIKSVLFAALLCGFCLNGYGATPLSIKITKEPAKTVYGQGQELNPTGLEVMKEYKKNSELADTRSLKYTGYNGNKPGKQTVTVVFTQEGFFKSTSLSATFTVTVVPVERVSIQQLPVKITYLQGDDFDPKGLVAQVDFENQAVPTETVELNQLKLSGYSKNAAGVQTIAADYYDKQATFEVNVAAFTGITVTSPPDNTQYFTGEDVDLTGLVATGNWEGAGEKPVHITQDHLSSFDRYRAGTQDVLITYLGKTASFPVTYLAMQSLALTSQPQKLEYAYGEELDLIGLNVQGTRQGATTIEMVDVSRMKVSGYDPFKAENQVVTLSLGGKTTNFRVTVLPSTLPGIWRIEGERSWQEFRMTNDNKWIFTMSNLNGEVTGTYEQIDKQTVRMKDNGIFFTQMEAVLVNPNQLKVKTRKRLDGEQTLIFTRLVTQ